jgi:hypothetical protein
MLKKMGIGSSTSYNESVQNASADITQQYSGTCQVSCVNTIDNTNIDIINSTVGGDVSVTQTCSANGQCLFNNTMGATSDVMFKAANSSNALNAGSWLSGLFNTDISKNESIQNIQENITQAIDQECKVTSTNQMNNVDIFAANSYIGGNIAIGQYGSANGNCQLDATMTASDYATGTIDNCSTSGKKVKKKCGAGKGGISITQIIIYVVVAVVLFVVIIVISKIFGKSDNNPLSNIGSKIKSAIPSSILSKTPSGSSVVGK